jgi:hypothetical protein
MGVWRDHTPNEDRCIYDETYLSPGVQDGLVPASAIGVTVKQRKPSIKSQLSPKQVVIPKGRNSHAKRKKLRITEEGFL